MFSAAIWDLLTLTKYPPASMKVMTVTEAKVVALFMSINVAPIASPSPCHYPPNSGEIGDETVRELDEVYDREPKGSSKYLSGDYAQEDCEQAQEKGPRILREARHEINDHQEKHGEYEV